VNVDVVSHFFCRLCGSDMETSVDFGEHPIVNKLLEKPRQVKKYPMQIGGCKQCGLFQILEAVDAFEFYTNYDNGSSVKREPHLHKLLNQLSSILNTDARIIDIGCNDGKFLSYLRDTGFTNLVGLEPTKNMSSAAIASGFKVFNTFLDVSTADEIVLSEGKFDCVVIRQVLEHIANLENFGLAIQRLVKPGGVIAIEVPDAELNFRGPDYALWEEHVNYFTIRSLEIFLQLNGIKLVDSYVSIFSGLCLTVLGRKVDVGSELFSLEPTNDSISVDFLSFKRWSNRFLTFQENVKKEIESYNKQGFKVVLYGVGSRSSPFLNIVGICDMLSFAIDDDPRKQGKFLPGSNIEIVSREIGFGRLNGQTLVLLGVNKENEEKLINELSFHKSLIFKSVLPPSEYLLSAFNS
jgi:SAM-dependent methyltransferase